MHVVSEWLFLLFGFTVPMQEGDVPECVEKSHPFHAHYVERIEPLCADFERRRIEYLHHLQLRVRLAALGFFGLSLLMIYFLQSLEMPFMDGKTKDVLSFGGCLLIALLAWFSLPPLSYKDSVKAEIFSQIFSFYGSKFRYARHGRMEEELLEGLMIPSSRVYLPEDYISGEYQGVKLEIQEATLLKDSRLSNHPEIMLQGMMVLLSMNKNFRGKTLVFPDRGKIGNWLQQGSASHLERVALEDAAFEKLFEVYGTDQVESRYLLTPSMMERMRKLGELMGTQEIYASFANNKLLLLFGFPARLDRFPVSSVCRPWNFIRDIRSVLAEMEGIFGLIDQLRLDEQTRL